MRPVVALLLALAACGEPQPTVETETLSDVGTPCLAADGAIRVDFDTCLSSSCDTLVTATCAATLDGGALTITSDASIDRTVGGECTGDCGFVVATCTGDAPPAVDGVTWTLGAGTGALAACAEG